jgi:flagellar FliJ protein
MKKFKFRLEALLKVRQMQKEQAEINFATATAKYLSEKGKMSRLEEQLTSNIETFSQFQKQCLNIEKIKSHHNYLFKLKNELVQQKEILLQAEMEQKKALQALENAMKNLNIIEKLKIKRLTQYKSEILQAEQQYLDDLGIQVYTRRVR